MNLALIQRHLQQTGLDGWLLYDSHGLNPVARQISGLAGMVTRRWFMLIPAQGEPEWVIHRMESPSFASLPGKRELYLTWQELDAALKRVLSGRRKVAMEYSPDNAIPYIARVDAGTIEKVRGCGVEVVSSADLIARALACWTPEQIASHHRAAKFLLEIKDAAYALIRDRVAVGKALNEHEVASFIREQYKAHNLTWDDEGPICAVDANASNAHYEPTAAISAPIKRDQLVLLDIWAKENIPDGVYADITWTAYTGSAVPAAITKVFDIVARARDRGVEFANERFASGAAVYGYEVDDATRGVINAAGYGERFFHRTGHSLGRSVHDAGPNIDNLETQDRRELADGMAFTIEPGIYLAEFGVRSEINVLVDKRRAIVTTLPLQTQVTPLLP